MSLCKEIDSCNQRQSCYTFIMFLLTRNALNRFKIRSIQQIRSRQSHENHSQDFHDKYGDTVLASGTAFCVVAWVFIATQIGIEWNLSPVGRVAPKEWNDE
ncbi:cytochrome c oxidase subunit 7B2, mitochondrial isoform X1 [Halichoerus grypus]|uniref:cytochrome c oxidase subunit 7B2, mitochondrial-like isoform X2 n=1 Tax=Halichoerus grypus TaxID=9711 RepID=UPI0016590344|nr:cytochrome c oxidase subunit 7B2, mitochondrial-like isoform X2 [Halichoerus grypus]